MARTVLGGELDRQPGLDFPYSNDKEMKGGYRAVADHTERDAIPTNRRSEGMKVRTLNDGKEWVLGSDLTTWTEYVSGGGAFFVRQTTAGPVNVPVVSQGAIEYSVCYTGGTITFNLPTSGVPAGYRVKVKDGIGNASVNNITVDPQGSNTIDGVTGTFILAMNWEGWDFEWDGVGWLLV